MGERYGTRAIIVASTGAKRRGAMDTAVKSLTLNVTNYDKYDNQSNMLLVW
jgi:hypothetical protein